MTTYNPALIGKLLNRAGHPGTPDFEALSAVRKAYSHCSTRNVTLDDVVNFVSDEFCSEIAAIPKKELLSEIADLKIALDDAQAQIVAQSEMIADFRRSNDTNVCTIATLQAGKEVDASTIAALESKVVSLNEALTQQQEALAVAIKPVVEPTTTAIEEPVAEKTVRRRVAAKRTTSTGVRRSARMTVELDESMTDTSANEAPEPDTSFDNRSWSLAEWARFNALAALGRGTSSIARTLTREFSRLITISCVGGMRRERWLSPGYGLA